MTLLSKRMRSIQAKIDHTKIYSFKDAVQHLQNLPPLKFVESLEAHIHLTVDKKKSAQVMRGVVVMPHGTGRKTRVIVLVQSKEQIEAILKEGAYRAGFDDLVNEIKNGDIKLNERDCLIATPAAMKLLVPLGPILGPKGLMPNPKLGTVTEDPATAVRHALLGQVQYRTDKGGVVRGLVGKLSFSMEALLENFQMFLASIIKNKPESMTKGRTFIKKIALSSTMGPEMCIDQSSLDTRTVL